MQPHLLTFTLSSALSLLFFASISASHNGLTKGYPIKGGGYRCGNIILSQELIDKAAQQAAAWTRLDLDQESYDEISIHPVKYEGNLEFLTDLELWSWPISSISQESSNADFYFIVLETGLLNILGVAWQHGNNLHERCIKESDLSDLLGHNVAIGYRCPLTFYSLEIIKKGLLISKEGNPASYTEKKIFEEKMPLFRWPISPDGNLHQRGSISIIMDNHSNLIGMVYKRKGNYFRCRLTIKAQITPKFIGQALEQKPTIVEPQSLDVFQCPNRLIRADQILIAVDNAIEEINRRHEAYYHKGYPAPYKTARQSGTTAFYLWPIKINVQGFFERADFNRVETLFALIDDFMDVHNVITRNSDDDLVVCERRSVDKNLYESRLPLFSIFTTTIKS